MPLPIDRNCWIGLEKISQLVGQINGMAYGCRRWNVGAMQDLDTQLRSLMSGRVCFPEIASLDTLEEMHLVNQLALEAFGMNVEGFQELAREEVGPRAADAVVGKLQSYWLATLEDIHTWYAKEDAPPTNGHANGPIPEAVR
jgi:hypothetical protein